MQSIVSSLNSSLPSFSLLHWPVLERIDSLPPRNRLQMTRGHQRVAKSFCHVLPTMVFRSSQANPTSSAAQGSGGSFKDRKPIGEVVCCDARHLSPLAYVSPSSVLFLFHHDFICGWSLSLFFSPFVSSCCLRSYTSIDPR